MDSRDAPVIKVITGMRLTGKSSVLKMFMEDLISSGFDRNRIYYRRFDDMLENELPDLRGLIDDVRAHLEPGRGTVIILDEMQDIHGWERAVNSFYSAGSDVYITGSNSNMLSSQLATVLSGRHIEIEIFPLSFTEFTDFRRRCNDPSDQGALLERFLRTGSLPAVALMDDEDLIDMMLTGIFNTVYVKDVVRNSDIRNEPLMSNLCRFLMRNIGDRTSVRGTARYITSTGVRTTPETIDNYIQMLESAKLFYRSKRMDSMTKDYLRTADKFYCTDIGIRNCMIRTYNDIDGMIENIVFMELMRRYGNVSTYDVEGKEVDFVVWTKKHKPKMTSSFSTTF